MSVLISSSPPVPSLFLELYQDHSIRARRPSFNKEDVEETAPPKRVSSHSLLPEKTFRPKLSFIRRKKSVVFADSMGLPLTQVKVLKPDAEAAPSPLPPRLFGRPSTSPISPPALRLNFTQPIARLNYLATIRQNHVGLENVLVDKFTLTGTVLVHNICFQKAVKVRITKDYWISHRDIPAEFSSSIAPDIDKFTFSITLPASLLPGSRAEFCVCAELGGEEFWDNNHGQNYQVECLLMSPGFGGLCKDMLLAGPPFRAGAPQGDRQAGIYY
ncbi:hypothetical protein ACHWQZ_G008279 [Mnemiopsis leidyi]